ncbi:hypothetical protein DER45DRAFT_613711 [Fusarium avenaceum]|nr:hypothetical protein DER45DRAFT_613711 [Fusarium avenaceum]
MDVAVAGEPEKTSEIPAWNHREPGTTGCGTGTVDPKFLLLNLSDMLLDEPQDYQEMDQEFLQFSKFFSTSVTSVDTLTARVTSLSSILQDLASNKPHLKEGLDQSCQRGFFTTVHFQNALTFAFRWRYYHKSPIHWPTFDPDRVSLHLLLAVALTGTAYLQYLNQSSQPFLTTSLLELSEKHIFKELKRLANQNISPVTSRHMLEVCQAAVLMNSLEGSFNHIEGRRRLAGNRIPTLVASLRKSGMLSLEHPPQYDTWEEFVYRETCIRVSTWTFVNDSLMVLCCNNPPIMTVKEMTGHLPCPNDLWEADSDITFQERARHRIARSYPSRCSEVVSGVLSAEWTISQAESFRSLDTSDLFYISAGLLRHVFHHRTSVVSPHYPTMLFSAFDRWDSLWAHAFERVPVEERRWLGIVRHSPEMVVLSRRMTELCSTEEAKNSAYLQGVVTYDTAVFHDFIQKYGHDGNSNLGNN